MKFLAVAIVLAAAASAAPTKEVLPYPPVVAPPPYGGIAPDYNPPLGGETPPITSGGLPPTNGAYPGGNNDDNSHLCPGGLLYTNPQCCSVGVLGVADLDCMTPSSVPVNGADFQRICAAAGSKAQCCAVPVAGSALLCEDVVGAN
ncbi:hypothetical protein ACSS6W_005182 [Trichoderma asperelloides]|uniref:Trihydrophobin n=1 Tax=Trichoderma asperellum TaxID=101201 RepID=A0A6V8R764_TRIAP|nr:hypothetical protein LI328DRAFT_167999 [Trichoderma asperelloides]GFP59946.1 trihydrophobin [Trichoderma asperellum]